MKINVFYNPSGISILDILTNDYILYLKKYLLNKKKESDDS